MTPWALKTLQILNITESPDAVPKKEIRPSFKSKIILKDVSIRAVHSSHQQHFVGNGGGGCRFEEKKKIQTDLVFSEVNNF